MTEVDLVIVNAKIVSPQRVLESGVAIDNGIIVSIAKEPNLPPATKKIDAKGLLLFPGLIDAHVHLRDPGFTNKEDFTTGTMAAANGGVTMVMDEPNTKPPVTTVSALKEKKNIVARKAVIDFGLSVAVNNNNLNEISLMAEEGAISFSMISSSSVSPSEMTIGDDWSLFEALCKVRMVGGIAAVTPSLGDFVREMKRIETSGRMDLLAHDETYPRASRIGAMAKSIALARFADSHVHFRATATSDGVEVMRAMKNFYGRISTEVTPHNLFLTKEDYERLGPYARVGPPLETAADVESLWEGLNDGTVDIIGTDHAPHTRDEKEAGRENIWKSPPGMPAVETYLRLLMTQVNHNRITLERLSAVTSEIPARIFNIYPQKGAISVGSDADLVIVDPKRESAIRSDELYSKCGWTPYEGWMTLGAPVMTLSRGITVMRDGEIVGSPGHGNFVRPSR